MQIIQHKAAPLAQHWPLLLDADPWRAAIEAYLKTGELWVTPDNSGLAVVLKLAAAKWEIKNIALAEAMRGQGQGKALLRAVLDMLAGRGAQSVEIGTGNSSLDQLALYQKMGFRVSGIIADFFADYPEPLIENGIACRDMIRLRLVL